ncbi:Hypothetical predicted protein, partial [Olea europaea subsp. europaea]
LAVEIRAAGTTIVRKKLFSGDGHSPPENSGAALSPLHGFEDFHNDEELAVELSKFDLLQSTLANDDSAAEPAASSPDEVAELIAWDLLSNNGEIVAQRGKEIFVEELHGEEQADE